MLVALSSWWTVGWIAGGAVVLVAAVLLLVIIGLGRRIAGQAEEITGALEHSRDNTAALFELAATNLALDRLRRQLEAAREEGAG